MTIFQLGLTVSVVGPRANLLNQDKWPLALRLTVGTDTQPGVADAVKLIPESLPWNIWQTPSVDVSVLDIDGKGAMVPCTTEAPLDEDKDFLAALKQSIEESGVRLATSEKLDLRYLAELGGTVSDDQFAKSAPPGDELPPDPRDRVSWPGLLMTASTLAAPTPSALLCTWYFWIDRATVADEQADGTWKPKDGFYLSATPHEFRGDAHGKAVVRKPDADAKYPVHVYQYENSGALAYCQGLDIRSVLDPQLDEMNDFWLAIRDSRDNSLLQLGAQLQQALNPATMLGAVSIDEFLAATHFCDPGDPANPKMWRPLTLTQMNQALSAWKEYAGHIEALLPKQWKAAILSAASGASEDQAQVARDAYGALVKSEFLDKLTTTVLKPDGELYIDVEALSGLIEVRLLPSQQDGAAPPYSGGGIDLMVGDEAQRLRHLDDHTNNAVDDVAQIQVFGRRSSDRTLVERDAGAGGAPWYALTSAQYTLPGPGGTLLKSKPRVLGVTTTYIDDVLYREVSFFGCNMVCDNPLNGVHREALDQDHLETFALAPLRRTVGTDSALLSIALRYGDYYEFATGVIDRAGGMAEELTSGAPWNFDLNKVATLKPVQHDHVRYLRQFAVGDLNVLPQQGTGWPQTPKGVALRCMQQHGATSTGPAPVYVFLAPADDAFAAPSTGARPPGAYAFSVAVPRTDEQTFMRWSMPLTTLPLDQRQSAVQALQAELVRIYELRDKLLHELPPADPPNHSVNSTNPPLALVDDPAVAGIGIRWFYDTGEDGFIPEPIARRTSIQLEAGAANHADQDTCHFVIGGGNFICLRLCVLVKREDLERFGDAVSANHLEDVDQPWKAGYVAFKETLVWAEAASKALPKADADRLTLTENDPGNVEVWYALNTLDADKTAAYANVSETTITSERWIWRNLPLPPESGFSTDPLEMLRRYASGPPPELMDAGKRDHEQTVADFDRLSEIDNGFVLRSDQTKPYPGPTDDRALLLVDERDQHTHADYLRYAIRFRSRYAPVLSVPQTDWSEKRRIALAFRGDRTRIKPPKVLAVLPLTQALTVSPVPQNKGGATPFLAVFDEAWFREYGIGERLSARVARVKPEIPEGEGGNLPTQLRFGPLPDHYAAANATSNADPLACFGPFGMTLDRSGSQARANATAFVVYPPPGTPAYFNLFVEFARVLDLPTRAQSSGAVQSEYSEAVPFYTIADSCDLQLGSVKTPLKLIADGDGYNFSGGERLTPFDDAAGAVLSQYRYLLIVGHTVRDGGRGVDVFLPRDALWLSRVDAGNAKATWISDTPRAPFEAGLVVEILLNGRFGKEDDHPLAGKQRLAELFLKLLPDADRVKSKDKPFPEDAPGMMRRVSPWFRIEVGVG
ncbi:hypothetical protein [Paraburkholderia graminis]|uniref:Uncharacterized protein n=1 Tax=Paraburkholderia graminis TaxID=60548 RepID=A0ABD5CB61_9BURK|nr:hypothetical protein [Paraburkholderia graminis]MDR6202509.1 hypothetical protein [Paraburkholderia graminis]